MVLRPEDIEQREFGSALRGFDKAEVRAFLRRVAGEVRYLESEVDAVRGANPPTTERSATNLELPRIDTRPAPPVLGSLPDNRPPSELPDLGAAGSQLPEPIAAPTTALSGAAPQEPEVDRFAALGDRIANLLRNAQETAEQVRHQSESDAAQVRAEAAAAAIELRGGADQYAAETRQAAAAAAEDLRASADAYVVEVRSSADADAAALRSSADEVLAKAQAEAAEIREHALADANEMRTRASEELDTARTDAATALAEAESEAVSLRQKAVDDGVASLSAREATITRQETEVAAEREQALAQLSNARSQVATLLQEARAQSEFIRQESEEIIRTKVRANMEQAQRRIDMLRTTETASKDRIAAARKELESALARLDAEPAPGLPAGTEDLVLEEAQQVALGNAAIIDVPGVDPIDSLPEDEALADGNDVTASGDFDFIEAAEVSEPEVFEPEVFEPEVSEPEVFDIGTTHEPEVARVDDPVAEANLVDRPSAETIVPPPPPPPPGFADDFVDPGVGQTVHGGSFFASRSGETTGELPPVPPPPPGFEAPIGINAPVFDSSRDPLEGLIPDELDDATSDLVEPAPRGEESISGGESQAQEAVADINTPENEDALAKLVREAMQRAVDSARGNQN